MNVRIILVQQQQRNPNKQQHALNKFLYYIYEYGSTNVSGHISHVTCHCHTQTQQKQNPLW